MASDKIGSGCISDTYKHVVESSLGTGVAEILTLPICTIKTNYQNTNKVSILETISQIRSNYGIRGFYNASGDIITDAFYYY